jgi:tRNA(Ile)-lysidine synthase
MDAAASTLERSELLVATFDHRSGPHSARAAALVERAARILGLDVVVGSAETGLARSEAAWREARWRFLRESAAGRSIVTAHTADDHVETILLRVLRGSGARGLAGISGIGARGGILRPLIGVSRARIEEYGASRGLEWVDDPGNLSYAFARNRVRLDVLPALRRHASAAIPELVELARRAVDVRSRAETLVLGAFPRSTSVGVEMTVAAGELTVLDSEALALVWPILAAEAGLVLDRRGIDRLVRFTREGGVGKRIQLSGGWSVTRARHDFELASVAVAAIDDVEAFAPGECAEWLGWTVYPVDELTADPWTAWLPEDAGITVRNWRAGDRVAVASGARRTVKQLLSRAGVTGRRRTRWPVILSGSEVVWVPGVGRAGIADRRRVDGLAYRCEQRSA